jgi:hypothetical protein
MKREVDNILKYTVTCLLYPVFKARSSMSAFFNAFKKVMSAFKKAMIEDLALLPTERGV